MVKANKEKQRKAPILRFKGFTDDWEQRELKNIFETVSKKGFSELPVLMATQTDGMIYRNNSGIDIKLDKSNLSNYKLVEPNQFVVHLRSFQGGLAASDIKGIASPAYTVLRFKDSEQVTNFWKEFFRSKKFINSLVKVTYGIRDGRTIKVNDLLALKYAIPDQFKEQYKISKLISSLNDLIALYERKIEKLESIYHYFQKNIFKHLYETKDTLNLGDFVNVNTGKLDANAMCNDGNYDFYTSGIKKYKTNSFSFSGPAITIAGNGATVGYLHLADGKFDAYQRTYVINNFKDVSRKYTYYTLQYALPRKIYKESRTGSIPYIVKEMLTELKIPKLDNSTQKLISRVFYKIDKLIISYKQIHNELVKIKDFCLNTMFI